MVLRTSPSGFVFPALAHKYTMNQKETYVTNLLQRRIKRYGLKPTQEQVDCLFRDFLFFWRQAENEAVCPRESKLWLLNALDSYLLGQIAKRTG